MSFIAFAIFFLLTAIAAIHVAWGTGVRWPRKTEIELVSTVVGHKSDRMPSPTQCFFAASAIFIPGLLALMLAGIIGRLIPSWIAMLLGAGAAAVFLGRGIAGYMPAWRARVSREPFATLDRHYYSPLCLLLAAGFFVLLINRLGT